MILARHIRLHIRFVLLVALEHGLVPMAEVALVMDLLLPGDVVLILVCQFGVFKIVARIAAPRFIIAHPYQILHLQRLIQHVSLTCRQEASMVLPRVLMAHGVLRVHSGPKYGSQVIVALLGGWFRLASLNHDLGIVGTLILVFELLLALLLVEAMTTRLVHHIPGCAIHHVEVGWILAILLHDVHVGVLVGGRTRAGMSMCVRSPWRAHTQSGVFAVLERVPIDSEHVGGVNQSSLLSLSHRI